MDFLNLVKTRYSYRSYDKSKPVEKASIMRILEAGRMAPSAANRQPWSFLVIQSADMLAKIHETYPSKWFTEANTVLVVKGRKNDAWVRKSDGYNAIETDLTIAMDHMILAATAEGLATCWIAAFDYQKLRDVLQLSLDEVVFAISPLGYAGEDLGATRTKSRKPIEEIVTWL
jgi:nitroreductase